jgi:EAL domain-containing protein (putative c-di-GMP-specific phosphodiesterase class I)
LSVSLAEALKNDWVHLWYQPKVDLASFALAGAEGLARVVHPSYGVFPPATFLPPAGDPLYAPLSAQVIRLAMADWKLFSRDVALSLAVNVPVSVISAPDFVSLVRTSRPQDPRFHGFMVEVTENELVDHPEQVREVAAQLRLYDVCLSIDDFGTACSSLSRFLDLSFTEVKIDRRFVDGCASDVLKGTLCRTIVDLSHSFGARVCAEGIEEVEDARHLASIGCDLGQGYLFGKPIPVENFALSMFTADPFARQRELIRAELGRSRQIAG